MIKPKPKLVGYIRVSSEEQELRMQMDALESSGCLPKHIFNDKISGARDHRPGLDNCLRSLQAGDTLLVWRLDRLGRSLRHLIDVVEELGRRNVHIRSVGDGGMLDTTTANGKLIFHIFGALAEFERTLIQERTRAGLAAARARGRLGGRRPLSPSDPKVRTARTMHAQGVEVADICKGMKISRATLYRYLSKNPASEPISCENLGIDGDVAAEAVQHSRRSPSDVTRSK